MIWHASIGGVAHSKKLWFTPRSCCEDFCPCDNTYSCIVCRVGAGGCTVPGLWSGDNNAVDMGEEVSSSLWPFRVGYEDVPMYAHCFFRVSEMYRYELFCSK